VKVAELEGVKLDYWVAQANILNGGHWKDIELRPYRPDCWTLYDRSDDMIFGWVTENILDSIKLRQELNLGNAGLHFWPSVDWQHGGPIIQAERISVYAQVDEGNLLHWVGVVEQMPTARRGWLAPTPLIAAMRAYVASKYGAEVPDE
jgi:hypothetical protein